MKFDRWPLAINKEMDSHAAAEGLGHWSCVSPGSNLWWIRIDGWQASWNGFECGSYPEFLRSHDRTHPINVPSQTIAMGPASVEIRPHQLYRGQFQTSPDTPKLGLSKQEIERKLYEASEQIKSALEECFPTTPEGVAAMEAQFAKEGPVELPESLRDASKVLERIIKQQER